MVTWLAGAVAVTSGAHQLGRCSCALRTRRWAHSRPNRRVGPMPTPGPMALAGGNGRVVASGRPFDRQPDARGKRAVVDSGRPRHRAEGTPQPCLRVTGAISSAVHPPCGSDCVVQTPKTGSSSSRLTSNYGPLPTSLQLHTQKVLSTAGGRAPYKSV